MSDTHNSIRFIACPHIFSTKNGRVDVMQPAGGNVTDLLRSIGWPHDMSARVFIDGCLIEQAQWEYAVPRAGQSVVARAVPMGGGGGGKDVGRLVAMIAVISLALAAPAMIGSLGLMGAIIATTPGVSGALIAGTSIALTLAVNGMIPAPLPRRALPQPLPEPRLQEAA